MVQKIGICLLRDEYSVVTAASRKPLADYFRGQHRTGRSGDGQSAIPRSGYLAAGERSEEHTSELQSLMRISYAVFCLKKKNKQAYTILHGYLKTHPPEVR